MNLSNITCEEKQFTFGNVVLDIETETLMRYITIVIVLLTLPFGVGLNCLLVFLVAKFKILRQTTFYLALHVVVVDLAFIVFTGPLRLINGIAQQWILGSGFCTFSTFVTYILIQLRQYLMFLFVTDRFWLVFRPFKYSKYRNKIVTIISIGTCTISVIISLPILIFGCISFNRVTWYCWINGGCTNRSVCHTWTSVSLTLAIILGSFVPFIMYIALLIKARQIRNVAVVPVSSEQTPSQVKTERKTNTTFLLLFLSVLGIRLLPFLINLIGGSIFRAQRIPVHPAFQILITLGNAAYQILPVVDPIAIMRHPDVRKTLSILKGRFRNMGRKFISKQDSTTETPNSTL